MGWLFVIVIALNFVAVAPGLAQNREATLASLMKLPAAERQVFLDGDQRPQLIREQFERTLSIARQRGTVIAIGHPHAATLEALAQEVPRAKAMGYRFVPVSALLDRPRPVAAAAAR